MSRCNAEEYLDALVTIELATQFAEIDGRPVNKTIKACWASIRSKVGNSLNRGIFDGVCRQMLPHGALCMLRRQLDEAIS